MTLMIHPNIFKIMRKTVKEEELTMSIVTDEALCAGCKALGRIE